MGKRVLILCTGNSCRSQMAQGLWNQLGAGRWEAFSAGSQPSGYVHPLALVAMKEVEIDIAAGRSKHVDEFAGQAFDLVVTVCDNAKETCPVMPGAKQTLHWPFDDPAAATGSESKQMAVFARVRDEIRDRIRGYLGAQ